MQQQLVTFEELFSAIGPHGIYLVEDLHTSYWEEFGGGYRKNGTFIEFSKTLVDKLNAWHSREPALAPDDFTKSVTGLHFYDSVVVIEKHPNPAKPKVSKTGELAWDPR